MITAITAFCLLMVLVGLNATPKLVLCLTLVQPVFKTTTRHSLPRRRLFQRKAKPTYQERKARRLERMWIESFRPFDLNHAA